MEFMNQLPIFIIGFLYLVELIFHIVNHEKPRKDHYNAIVKLFDALIMFYLLYWAGLFG